MALDVKNKAGVDGALHGKLGALSDTQCSATAIRNHQTQCSVVIPEEVSGFDKEDVLCDRRAYGRTR